MYEHNNDYMQIRSCNTTWRKPVAVLGAFWLSLALAFAQSKTISGVVQDGAGEPLIGATVIISGSHLQDQGGGSYYRP